MSEFTRPINETVNYIDSINGVAWIQYVNLGFVLIFMSINIKMESRPYGFFEGIYETFNTAWYARWGMQIIKTFMIEIAVGQLTHLVQILFFGGCRQYDRGCCVCDRRKTKKLLQIQYEKLYVGPVFPLDARLAIAVSATWITFMFSATMPLIYLVTALNFTVQYWIDKAMVLRFYRNPKNFDERTINHSIWLLKFCFVFHGVMGYLMLMNTDII